MQIIYQSPQRPSSDKFCIFAHFDKSGNIKSYVKHYLKQIKELGFNIILVSTSPSLEESDVVATQEFVDTIILRENIGYDFGSYKIGIEIAQKHTPQPNQILITNDSVFGPFQSLKSILETSKKYDIYAITDSYNPCYHLQSYFILFNEKALKGTAFSNFWDSVEFLDSNTPNFKQEIINRYEIGGSQHFLKYGYNIGAAFSFQDIISSSFKKYLKELDEAKHLPYKTTRFLAFDFNASHNYWDDLLELGYPFIKRELLIKNPTGTDISYWPDLIHKKSKYDLQLILDELYSSTSSNDFLFLCPLKEIAENISDTGRIELSPHPLLSQWKDVYHAPAHRIFLFDEPYYLQNNPDVAIALQNKQIPSTIAHLKSNGFLEGRRWRVIGEHRNPGAEG